MDLKCNFTDWQWYTCHFFSSFFFNIFVAEVFSEVTDKKAFGYLKLGNIWHSCLNWELLTNYQDSSNL